MSKFKRLMVLSLAAVGLIPAVGASAAVSLVLAKAGDPKGATGTTLSVGAGGTFQLVVEMISTSSSGADQVYGVSYGLQSNVSGYFKLTARDPGTGSDPWNFYQASNGQILAASAATLNPANGTSPGAADSDLGAGLQNGDFVSNNYGSATNTYNAAAFNPAIIATYTLAVANNTPSSTYTISILPLTYAQGPPTFASSNYSNPPAPSPVQQTFQVTVTPEPSSALLIGLGGGAMGLLRRRRTAVASR